MTRINTNVGSLVGRNNLVQANASLSRSLTRLSTGLRINTGADDPAGLIASENLRSDITSIRSAISNTDRASQVIATADSSLGQVSSLLNDIRGLVTESANAGALSQEQIDANQLQIDSSLGALNRIAQTTTFQGRRLLDGSLDFITEPGAEAARLSNLQIDQANLGATGKTGVDINVSAAATRASIEVGNLPDVTPQVTQSVSFDIETTAGAGGAVNVDFTPITTDGVESVSTITLDSSDVLTITAVEDGILEGTAGNGFTIAVTDSNTGLADATATYDEVNDILQISADITGGVTSGTVAAAIAAVTDSSGGSIFTAGSSANNALVAADEATIEGFTAGNDTTGAAALLGASQITINGTAANGATEVDISFAFTSALGAGGANTEVVGDKDSGYTVLINNQKPGGVTISQLKAGIETIAEVDSVTINSGGALVLGDDVSAGQTELPGAAATVTGGTDQVITTETIDLTTDVGVTGEIDVNFVEYDLGTGPGDPTTALIENSPKNYTVRINNQKAVSIDDIRAELENITEVGTAAFAAGSPGTSNYNAAADTEPVAFKIVGAGSGTSAIGIDADLVLELAGATGSEVLDFEAGTSLQLLVDGVNAVSDATGVSAAANAGEDGIVFTSTDYGSNSFIDINVISEGGGGDFVSNLTAGGTSKTRREVGTDVAANVNGITANGDGNDIKIATSTLDVSATVETGFTGTIEFDITGGGALFQLGPDVVSNQQARLGISSVNTAALGGVSGLLYELETGGTADLSTDANKAAKIVEEAINQVTSLRGRLGAFQRTSLETNRNALSDTLANLTEAESSIRDADFAAETAELTRSQILVQSGTRVLAIANQNPQNVLGLLG